MHLAAEKGKHIRLRKYLTGDVDKLNEVFETPLCLAASNGHLRCVTMLLDAKANVNAYSGDETPIVAAAENGHLDVVNTLIDARADLSVVIDGDSVLSRACKRRDGDNHLVVASLLAAGAPLHPPGASMAPLHSAIIHNALESMKLLISAGDDPNLVIGRTGASFSATDIPGDFQRPLNAAAWFNNLPAMQLLLEAKADVNADNGSDCLAIVASVMLGNVPMVQTLIAAGAIIPNLIFSELVYQCEPDGSWKKKAPDIFGGPRDGVNSLQHDVVNSFIETRYFGYELDYPGVMKALIDAKADVSARDDKGFTPLMVAAGKNNVDAVSILLAAGANPNDVNYDGGSALMYASRHGHTRVVALLCHAGAHLNHICIDATVLDAARSPEIKAVLAEAGGRTWYDLMREKYKLVRAVVEEDLELVDERIVDAGEEEKEVALKVAVVRNKAHAVKLLLAVGVRTTVLHYGESLLRAASFYGFVDVVRELLDAGADITAKARDNRTAIQVAAAGRHRDVVALLLARSNELKMANK
jgi:ankyrin repeat protein